MATADPTTEFLSSLRDPAKWVIVSGVPVCRPHRRKTPAGTVELTAAGMATVANATNRHVRESGSPARITVGHVRTDPEFPETQPPPLVGFALDARAGTFGPAAVPGVLIDLYVRRDQAEVLRKYPFRSMEFDPATKRICGLALLVRDPWLDLGAIHYAGGNWRVTYEGEAMDEQFTPEEEAAGSRHLHRLRVGRRWHAGHTPVTRPRTGRTAPGSPAIHQTTSPTAVRHHPSDGCVWQPCDCRPFSVVVPACRVCIYVHTRLVSVLFPAQNG